MDKRALEIALTGLALKCSNILPGLCNDLYHDVQLRLRLLFQDLFQVIHELDQASLRTQPFLYNSYSTFSNRPDLCRLLYPSP